MIIYDRQTREKLLEIPGDILAGQDLRQFNLRYADLSDLDLSNCNFENMDLEGAQFANSDLSGANFTNANLAEAILTRTNLSNAKLVRTKMSVTAFSYATLNSADLSEIIVDGMVNFRWIVAHGAKFKNIKNLRGANFFGADLTDADFEGTDFLQVSESDRTNVILTRTIFEYLMRS
jgi:uncharacterized protein YjbI with pentapeptide repeats